MQLVVFSAKPYDQSFLNAANVAAGERHQLLFLEAQLNAHTAMLAKEAGAVCAFVNDRLDRPVLEALHKEGIGLIALRSAGYNNVDLGTAAELGIEVARVPAYSPEAVAEHSVTLMLALNRQIYRAHNRVRDGNFALEGLLGFDMHGKTAGIIGTGKIGGAVARILTGFGCRLLAYDTVPDEALARSLVRYVPMDELLEQSDIVTLHCPLTPDTRHIIDEAAISCMKPGVMLINTSRGAVIDTRAVIDGLKSGRIGYLGLDVYEEEENLFFEDLSSQLIQDDVFARLLTFPNVLITGHQGFFTREAMEAIAAVTIENLTSFERDGVARYRVSA